jgi:hypothetical protein
MIYKIYSVIIYLCHILVEKYAEKHVIGFIIIEISEFLRNVRHVKTPLANLDYCARSKIIKNSLLARNLAKLQY